MNSLLSFLTLGLSLQAGKKEIWLKSPVAKIKVTARGPVLKQLIQLHVLEAQEALNVMLKNNATIDVESVENVEVEIIRQNLVDDEHASIQTSISVSMACGAFTVMNG